MNNPIDFFKSLFKSKKTSLTGNEVIALQYLHPEKGAINTGDYCTTQDIANLSPPYVLPAEIFVKNIEEFEPDGGVTIDGVLLKDGFIDPTSISAIDYYKVTATGLNAAGAKLLKYGYNQVTTATSSEKCVALPFEITNQKLYIKNSTSESIDVYGNQSGDFIIQDVTNSSSSVKNSITLNPGQSVELIRIGSVWVAVPFNGVANKPLIYKAILTQSGTNAPVATVLNSSDNNYLGDLTWNRTSTGYYYCNLTGATISNTLVNISYLGGSPTQNIYCIAGQSGNQVITLASFNSGAAYDGFSYLSITIEYYGS